MHISGLLRVYLCLIQIACYFVNLCAQHVVCTIYAYVYVSVRVYEFMTVWVHVWRECGNVGPPTPPLHELPTAKTDQYYHQLPTPPTDHHQPTTHMHKPSPEGKSTRILGEFASLLCPRGYVVCDLEVPCT